MATANNINELANIVNQMFKEAINEGTAVKSTVIEAGKRHVQTDVYNVYTPNPENPKSYKRTGELKEDWETQPTAEGMVVFNTRTDKETGKDIVDTVEYGRNYDYEFEYSRTPRPFIENTFIELQSGNEITNALKQDLRAKGLIVE